MCGIHDSCPCRPTELTWINFGSALEGILVWDSCPVRPHHLTLTGRLRVVHSSRSPASLGCQADGAEQSAVVMSERWPDTDDGDCVNDRAASQGTVRSLDPAPRSWTDLLPSTEHVAFFKGIDWASTPLGPLDSWCQTLRFAANMVFANSRPACVYWGPQLTALYNEKWIEVAASAHPRLMGNSFWVGFPDAWADMKPLFNAAMSDLKCIEFPRMELSISRGKGFLEEVYFMGQLIPLRGDSMKAEADGVYNTGLENTDQILYERRRNLLNSLSALPDSRLSDLFPRMIDILQSPQYSRDISALLIYATDDERASGKTHVSLKVSIGFPAGHPCAPEQAVLDERGAGQGFVPFLEEVRSTGKHVLLLARDGSLDRRAGHLLDGMEWRGWGEKCRDLSILPLHNAAQLIGFMVIATNARREYDGNSVQFVHDLTQQICVKWGNAITTETALKREETLTEKLKATEERIRQMAEYAPVGMIQLNLNGDILWANEEWYQITSHSRDTQFSNSWMQCYVESSRQKALQEWNLLIQGDNTSCELKLHRLFKPPVSDGVDHHVWVNARGFPLFEDGKIKYIMGTLTDVSHLKWAEHVQTRGAALADEAKRRQEEFIDITSHEMRNPLSAIYQCASMISTSLDSVGHNVGNLLAALESNVDTANTILTCASHQKRIIDDVLILNRLENMMLSISPVKVRIPELLDHVSKIFSVEVTSDGVDLQIIRHPSYDEHNVDIMHCDPSRLTQIFINLISNAIKFTKARKERRITVRYGASRGRPDEVAGSMTGEGLHWCPTSKHHDDLTTGADWGDGEPLYMRFAVQDTGPGLEANEVRRLFKRFSQANAKTHITYGGSGLGLYISRELAEKQGGRIGISSTPNVGTVIAFYIKAKRGEVDAPGTEENGGINGFIQSSPRKEKRKNTGHYSNLADQKITNQTHMATKSKDDSKISILLAEDNLINQKILRKQLQSAGYEVHIANHGIEALQVLERSSVWITELSNDMSLPKIDIILMDWEMPQMDGLTCSRKIRKLEKEGKLAQIPIIAITANARIEQIQMAMEAGMNDVLTKPFLVPELTAKINKWLNVGGET